MRFAPHVLVTALVTVLGAMLPAIHGSDYFGTGWALLDRSELESTRGSDPNLQRRIDPCGNPVQEHCSNANIPKGTTDVADLTCSWQVKNSNPKGGCHYIFTSSTNCVVCDPDNNPDSIIVSVTNPNPPGMEDNLNKSTCSGARKIGACDGSGNCASPLPDGSNCTNGYNPSQSQ